MIPYRGQQGRRQVTPRSVRAARLAYRALRVASSAGGVAVSSVLGKRAYDYATSSSSSSKRAKSKPISRGRVHPDGTSAGSFKTARTSSKRRLKKTIESRLKTLEKTKAIDSTKTDHLARFFKIPKSGSVGVANCYEFDFIRSTTINPVLTSMSGAAALDYTAEKTKVMVSYSGNLRMKNAITNNVHIEYFFVRCNDDVDGVYLTSMRAGIIDRFGITINTSFAQTTATATAESYPTRVLLNVNQVHLPLSAGTTSMFKGSPWTKITKTSKVTLGPGDSIDIPYFKSPWKYSQEELVGGNFTRGDVKLVMKVVGGLSHEDDTTTYQKVGYGYTALDCEYTHRLSVRYSDGKGLRQYTSTNTNSVTGFTTPSHVDNHASAVEPDNQ